MMGIKETKEVISFIAALGNGIADSLEDDGFSWTDLPNFFPALLKILPAVDGIEKVKEEYLDMDEEELAEVKAHAMSEFQIGEEDAEEYIERAFSIATDIAFLIQNIIENRNA